MTKIYGNAKMLDEFSEWLHYKYAPYVFSRCLWQSRWFEDGDDHEIADSMVRFDKWIVDNCDVAWVRQQIISGHRGTVVGGVIMYGLHPSFGCSMNVCANCKRAIYRSGALYCTLYVSGNINFRNKGAWILRVDEECTCDEFSG